MKRTRIHLLPSLLLAGGILAATFLAVRTAESTWLVLSGPLLLGVVFAAAGLLSYRLQMVSKRVVWGAFLHGGVVFLASAIIALRDPAQVSAMIPVLGAIAVVVVPNERSARCCPVRAKTIARG